MTSERRAMMWVASILVTVVAIGLLRGVLLPFVVGLAMAYAFNPLANRIEGLGLPRALAAAAIVFLMTVLVALALVLLVPLIVAEIRDLAANLPQFLEDLRKSIEELSKRWLGKDVPGLNERMQKSFAEMSQNWASSASSVLLSVLSGASTLLNLLSLLIITPIVTFYLLNDWPSLIAKIDSWLPREHASTIRRLSGEINGVLGGFVHGQGTLCMVLALFYAIGLWWAGIKSGLLIGLIAGLLSFVPFIGFMAGLILAGGVAMVQFWPEWTPLLKVVGVFAAGQVLDAAFLSPKIVAGHIKLHPIWLIFAILVFGYLFGVVGTLVAVPAAAGIGVLARFGLQEYLRSPLYTGERPGPERAGHYEPGAGREGRPRESV